MLELTAGPLSKPRRTTSGVSGFVSLVGRNNCVALTSLWLRLLVLGSITDTVTKAN